MDITDTLAPKSDQLDAVELAGGPRTVTITSASPGSAEQPVNIHLAEVDRPWRPAKTVRRLLAAAWGTDTTTWAGRRATIYLDPHVKYAGKEVGGIRVSALSGIDKPLTVPVIETRGKITQITVQPLAAAEPAARPGPVPPVPTLDQIAAATSEDTLRAMWSAGGDQQAIRQRLDQLRADTPDDPEPAA
jgi:hypothetical protein